MTACDLAPAGSTGIGILEQYRSKSLLIDSSSADLSVVTEVKLSEGGRCFSKEVKSGVGELVRGIEVL